MVQTVREFVDDAYRLINPSSPTQSLHGNDFNKGLQYLNELLESYASSGQMITIQQEITLNVPASTSVITFGAVGSGADVENGRLANVSNSWLLLEGVSYPLTVISRYDFDQSYKYAPLAGLPRFLIVNFETFLTSTTIYPQTSQGYEFHLTGKFQKTPLNKDDDMSQFPLYYVRFLRFALARDLAMYKGRAEAWTVKLESMYQEAYENMVAVTPLNLKINGDQESLLNGSWRVKAGI